MICQKCGNNFPTRLKINGSIRNLCKRKFCLDCSPFGKHNTSDLVTRKEKVICKRCGNESKDRRTLCGSCRVILSRQKKKKALIKYKGGECEVCGYNKCVRNLEFHHKDPTQKDFGISKKQNWNIEKLKKEVDKCILVCSNCHGEIHEDFIVGSSSV